MQTIQNYKIAESVSIKICEKKEIIDKLLLKRNAVDYEKVNMIISGIKKEFNLDGVIDIIFGIDIRNSKMLPERKNGIEMILSPVFKKENLDFLNILYNKLISNKKYICDNWSIVRYKPWNPETLENINITYTNNDGTKKIITHSDIEYYSFNQNFDKSDNTNLKNYEKLNVILFIRDDVKKYILKKHSMSGNEIYMPRDSSLLTLLDATIGEYNMLNIVNHMEICLKSTNVPVEKLPLSNLCKKIKMIDTAINTINKIHYCLRCEYSNTQVKLIKCKCNKAFYCDEICKKAHIDIHKKFCCYLSDSSTSSSNSLSDSISSPSSSASPTSSPNSLSDSISSPSSEPLS